jgi:uncharacterized protein (TIGR00369 family)
MSSSKLHFPIRIPFVEKLGLELHGLSDGHCELRVDLDEAHTNSWEVAHGGVVMTMLDVAMAHAARHGHGGHAGSQGGGVATIEMKTAFMRPAQGQLRAIGKALHRTTTMVFCEGSLFDDEGRLCAHATGTFKVLRGLPGRDGIKHTRPHQVVPDDNPTGTSTDTPKDPE